MASRLNWAMEKMGWRMPDETDELVDEQFEDVGHAREYPFSDLERNQVDTSFSPVRAKVTVMEDHMRSGDRNIERQRIMTVHPHSYADALAVGEAFRDGIPVIMNLTDMDDSEARRIIDFAAGLTFGLKGSIERVTTRVFLLSPEDIEVSHDRAGKRSTAF